MEQSDVLNLKKQVSIISFSHEENPVNFQDPDFWLDNFGDEDDYESSLLQMLASELTLKQKRSLSKKFSSIKSEDVKLTYSYQIDENYYGNESTVFISGQFNNWDFEEMKKEGNTFTFEKYVKGGQIYNFYLFINGDMVVDEA